MSKFILPDPAYDKALLSLKLAHREPLSKNAERTFFLSLHSPTPLTYQSGDSFAIYPENNIEETLLFCAALKLDPELKLEGELTVYTYLKKKVSLSKWTSKMSQALFNEPKLPEAFKDLSPLAILHNTIPTYEQSLELLKSMPPQMPRYYSIASSPHHNPHQMDLLVSLSSFEVEGITKFGLASSYLCLDAPLDTLLHGFLHSAEHFRLPPQGTPLIMIGPGTGVAPFRAFIQERALIAHGHNWLFFGERTKAHDFYFEEEFKSHQAKDLLKLSLAFSRDQAEKRYVQHLMLEQKEELYDWIRQGAYLYVCGDAKKMARDVEQALVQIIAEYEALEPKEALAQLRLWRKQKRYNQDVY